MPRFAANLSLMYNEHPFLERFAAASADGFKGVEFLFPYAWEPAELVGLLQSHQLAQVLFNAPPGGNTQAEMAAAWDQGERGTACLPGRQTEFQAGIELALQYAKALDCPRVHVMAGRAPTGSDPKTLLDTYLANLRWAAPRAHALGVELLIEPINTRDMPGYFLNLQQQAHDVVAAVNSPALKVQMDLYHCQIMEGDLATRLRRYLPTGHVGHIQIAGVPERHEPDVGEIHYPYLFNLIDSLGYTGWVGCEYRPKAGATAGATRQGLGWLGLA